MPLKLLVLICLALAPVAHAANLLVNGDFESPGAAFTANYGPIAANTIPGWTSAVGNGIGPANYYNANNSTAIWIPNPQSGNYSVQIDSSTEALPAYTVGGSLSQTVSLTAGVPYVLSFYISAEVDTVDINGVQVATTTQVNVLLNGGGFANQNMVNPTTGSTGFQATWNGAPKADPELSWVQYSLSFTPTATGNVTIQFQDVWVNNAASSNASLDNIDLQAVPEMTHWSIFTAFAAITALSSVWHRKRKRLGTNPPAPGLRDC
jgi:hypothetical protein